MGQQLRGTCKVLSMPFSGLSPLPLARAAATSRPAGDLPNRIKVRGNARQPPDTHGARSPCPFAATAQAHEDVQAMSAAAHVRATCGRHSGVNIRPHRSEPLKPRGAMLCGSPIDFPGSKSRNRRC